MSDMPRPRLPYLVHETTRHGARVWYFRRGKGARLRLPEPYGSREFMAAYQAALAGEAPAKKRQKTKAGSLRWLVDLYRASSEWSVLAPATKKQRDNIFTHVLGGAGDFQADEIERKHIVAGRERRKDTPGAANNYLKTMRAVFSWAVERELIAEDPTVGVKKLKLQAGGFHSWTEDEIRRFEARWPLGTRERLALAILLYTGLRRGDAVKLGRQHIRDGWIFIRTEKTRAEIRIPVMPLLAETLAAGPVGDLAFLVTRDGQPMAKAGFGNWFREACRAAGVPGAAHGLRKAGARRLAEGGATDKQLNAVYGWSDESRESATYTRAADRARLAEAAFAKLPEAAPPAARPTRKLRSV
ncbi:site-specific integrase [Methylocystis iwaonis]|uniref:tyrosine-type recombinase/integrase n=1 Tax=Methylocystis iwaonis TaxID=2885079 RepID=UPI002E7AE7E3|nr:site-specific integrase [Methylocystis iwaonis]